MKTKTSSFDRPFLSKKRFILLEIAIVLCSVFLVALPALAIAAEQDDYILDIYGNANEDDTIDMRDLTYVKLIFFGKKPETELADAKYDGKVNPLDFIQIKLIIVGKEKELTIVDSKDKIVTVRKPIERIVVISSFAAETLCAFGAQDRIVGVDEYTKKNAKELKIFLEDKPSVGNWDMEKIMDLKPDIVLTYAVFDNSEYEEQLDAFGVPLVQMDFFVVYNYFREIRNLGWILSKQERAEELVNFEQQHFDLIEERVKDLKEEQKPRVYLESWVNYYTFGPGQSNYDSLIECGGISIFADLLGYSKVDPEAILERKPQIILKLVHAGMGSCPNGYGVTDTGPMEEFRNAIMSRPGWDHIDAVKNDRVYLLSNNAASTHSSVWRSYIAKMVHPELFEDIDPVDIHREWLERFLGIEYKGVYAYPIPS